MLFWFFDGFWQEKREIIEMNQWDRVEKSRHRYYFWICTTKIGVPMPTYLYYTQGILDFQEETATYSEERLEIRLRRKKHRCPKCKAFTFHKNKVYISSPLPRVKFLFYLIWSKIGKPCVDKGKNVEFHTSWVSLLFRMVIPLNPSRLATE